MMRLLESPSPSLRKVAFAHVRERSITGNAAIAGDRLLPAATLVKSQPDPEATAEARQPSQTYVVRDRELTREGCLLVIEDCMGARETVAFRAIPDRSGARQLHHDGLHPLAVKLELDRLELSASCVVRSSDGPMRIGITHATALALCCLEGRHTILVRRGAAWSGRGQLGL
ncbi:hypothetical protein GCM10027062_04600 [Nocardioides hungaricus]